MPKFIFFDIDADLLAVYRRYLQDLPNIEVCTESTDIRDLDDVDVFVSPANSYGWMNGGIDAIYSQIFPNVQKLVQDKISKISDVNYSRPFLPVGSATIVTVQNQAKHTYQLICAPTMETPMNLSRCPENIYYCIYAILKVTEYLPNNYKVGIPGMGTGVGRLSAIQSAQHIRQAFLDYMKEKPQYPEGTKVILDKGDSYVISLSSSIRMNQKDKL